MTISTFRLHSPIRPCQGGFGSLLEALAEARRFQASANGYGKGFIIETRAYDTESGVCRRQSRMTFSDTK